MLGGVRPYTSQPWQSTARAADLTDPPRDPAIKRRWGEERIRATLGLYLHDKTAWPTPAQFRADGFGQLRAAITRCGAPVVVLDSTV